MNNKKLYFNFETPELSIIMTLEACMDWIRNDELDGINSCNIDNVKYTLTPLLLTDEEYSKLPECNF